MSSRKRKRPKPVQTEPVMRPANGSEESRVAAILARDKRDADREQRRRQDLAEHEGAEREAAIANRPPPPVKNPDGPAKHRQGHVRDRELSVSIGGKKGWRVKDDHPLIVAHAKQRITHAQFEAGKRYREAYEKINSSGTIDSTQERISSPSTSRSPWTQEQADAWRQIMKMERRLSRANRLIVRSFCGEGTSMVEALRKANVPFHPDAVIVRVQEALNELAGRAARAKAA